MPIDRVSTNAWPDIRPAVKATGRQVLIMAGIWTEVCLAQTTLSALGDGYTVYFVADCSGGVTQEAHEDAKQRMVQAGANGINWIGLVAEWTPDYTSPERAAVDPGLIERGSGRRTLDRLLASQHLGSSGPNLTVPRHHGMPTTYGRASTLRTVRPTRSRPRNDRSCRSLPRASNPKRGCSNLDPNWRGTGHLNCNSTCNPTGKDTDDRLDSQR